MLEGKWLTSVMMTADSKSNIEDNLEIMELMERKTIQLAKERGYVGIETINTSLVTIVSTIVIFVRDRLRLTTYKYS
jgi:hypothetical protein